MERAKESKYQLLQLSTTSGICALSILLLTSCASVKLDNAQRLIARPDFEQAKTAAPEWCRDALKTINNLEYEIERQ